MLATVMWAMGQSSVVTAGEQTGMASRIPFRTAFAEILEITSITATTTITHAD
jgi:hypothetical protein